MCLPWEHTAGTAPSLWRAHSSHSLNPRLGPPLPTPSLQTLGPLVPLRPLSDPSSPSTEPLWQPRLSCSTEGHAVGPGPCWEPTAIPELTGSLRASLPSVPSTSKGCQLCSNLLWEKKECLSAEHAQCVPHVLHLRASSGPLPTSLHLNSFVRGNI